jgi:hypothetical protein
MSDKKSPAWRREFQPVPATQRWGKYLLLVGVAVGIVILCAGFASGGDADTALLVGVGGLLLAVACASAFCECLVRHISQDICSRVSEMLDDRVTQ